jgi:hypothetical protein
MSEASQIVILLGAAVLRYNMVTVTIAVVQFSCKNEMGADLFVDHSQGQETKKNCIAYKGHTVKSYSLHFS